MSAETPRSCFNNCEIITYSQIVKNLICLLLALLSFSIWAQEPKKPFLIPFNDHGNWGYSDTLGNQLIKGQFKNASGFYKLRIGDTLHYVSNVETEYGKNLFSLHHGLLLPYASKIKSWNSHDFEENNINKRIYILNSDGKKGLYHFQFKYILAPIYDTIIACGSQKINYLIKRNKADSTYNLFDPSSGSIFKTDISSVSIYKEKKKFKRLFLARHLDSTYSIVDNNGLTSTSLDTIKEMEHYMPKSYSPRGDALTSIKEDLKVKPSFGGELINYVHYRKLPKNGLPGFKSLYIVKKNDAMGIVDETGRVVVSFSFDNIKFIGRGQEAILIKDDKFGRKLFTCEYPIIQPKYDKLSVGGYLSVNSNWAFAYFKVEVNGNMGFVGENGVEYFNFE